MPESSWTSFLLSDQGALVPRLCHTHLPGGGQHAQHSDGEGHPLAAVRLPARGGAHAQGDVDCRQAHPVHRVAHQVRPAHGTAFQRGLLIDLIKNVTKWVG